MYYEICVSLNGRHLFATAERSITDIHKANTVYKLFKEKFPEADGYKITLTKWDKVGKFIEVD